jgi:hypothetical protein
MPAHWHSGTMEGGQSGGTSMLESVRNLKTSEIELRQRLPQLECDWLVGQLRARRDIVAAACATDSCRLTIEYDADRLGQTDLVDLLNMCGVRVGAVHAPHV